MAKPTSKHPEPTQYSDAERPPNRLRAAWGVLRGYYVVPAQLEAEWIEYKIIFEDLLTRWGAQLARQAKAEAKKLRESDPSEAVRPPPPPPRSQKAELRTQYALSRFGGRIQEILREKQANVALDEGSEGAVNPLDGRTGNGTG
jgi:hypothetical protein